MEPIDEHVLQRVDQYIESLFIKPDPLLDEGLRDAAYAGMPPSNVSPNQGKLLFLIARMVTARRILEIGTLGGYSTVWLARALPADGKLITLEINPNHLQVAQRNIDRCGLNALVEIRLGRAAQLLREMSDAGEAPFDLVFIDADKPSYLEYLNLAMKLSRPGTIILADNVIRNGRVQEKIPAEESAKAAKDFNQAIATHFQLDSIVLPVLRDRVDGLSISIVH